MILDYLGGSKAIPRALVRGRQEGQCQKRRCMAEKVGVMLAVARGQEPGMPAALLKLEKPGDGCSPRAFRRAGPADTVILHF